jgi:hypothetical protein
MSKDTYEVRGLQFLVEKTDYAITHLFTFAISLRLPSGSYWVAYYSFMEGNSHRNFLAAVGESKVIARGTNVLPSLIQLEAGMSPKEVLDYDSTGRLKYIIYPHDKFVTIELTSLGKKKQQTLDFRLVGPALSGSNVAERFVYNGKIGLWELKRGGEERQQVLQRTPLSYNPPLGALGVFAP